ncbi:hypothetical protein B7463_g9153, partial [Scytalidium lignicola]
MSDHQASHEIEDRDAKKAVTAGLTDQETIEQLSSTGNAAKDKRRDSIGNNEEDTSAEARDRAMEISGNSNGIEVEREKDMKATAV